MHFFIFSGSKAGWFEGEQEPASLHCCLCSRGAAFGGTGCEAKAAELGGWGRAGEVLRQPLGTWRRGTPGLNLT